MKAADEARKALVPATPADYKFEMPADFKLPDGWAPDPNHPLAKPWADFAHKQGFSQAEYQNGIKMFTEMQIADHANLQKAVKARDDALGANGAQRVDGLNNWFKASFGDDLGKQMSQTLFTPGIVEAFEKLQRAVTSQGAAGFNGLGREGASNGLPGNWDKMSFNEKWAWQGKNAASR